MRSAWPRWWWCGIRRAACAYHTALVEEELQDGVSPHTLLYWEAIRHAALDGLREFSFGPPARKGVRFFKQKFRPNSLMLPLPQTAILKHARVQVWRTLLSFANDRFRKTIRSLQLDKLGGR